MTIGFDDVMPSPGSGYNEPSYRITVGDTDITPKVNGILVSLSLVDTRGGAADQLDLVLSDADGRVPFPALGKSLQLWIGWPGQLVDKGCFIINEVRMSGPPDQVTIRARSIDTNKTLPGQRTQSWHDTTLGAIVRSIAARHQLSVSIADTFDSVRVAHIDQVDESDLSFINRVSKRYGAVATVKANRLMLVRRGQGLTASGKPLPAIMIKRSEGDQFDYSETTADSYSGVKANWNEKSHGKLQVVVAGSADNALIMKETYTNEDDARRAASAEWERIKRGRFELNMTLAYGRPEVLAESPMKMRGFKRDIDQIEWVVCEVRHDLSSSGYTCQVRCEAMLGRFNEKQASA